MDFWGRVTVGVRGRSGCMMWESQIINKTLNILKWTHCVYVYMSFVCVHICMYACHGVRVGVRGQRLGIRCLFLSHEFQVLKIGWLSVLVASALTHGTISPALSGIWCVHNTVTTIASAKFQAFPSSPNTIPILVKQSPAMSSCSQRG